MALFTDTSAPTGGVPSLSPSQITQIYTYYLHREPTSSELASEMENAMKYSAAGIERQIALRASNVAGSGVRGDEGAPALTIYSPPPAAPPPPPVVSAITGALDTPASSVPPTGNFGTVDPSRPVNYATNTIGRQYGYGDVQYGGGPAVSAVAPSAGGFDFTTILIVGVAAVAAYFLLVK